MQERARELAVAESLDNGKPIKESRDVDVPLVAAWFFYYAGWADKLDYAGFGANPKALGVAAQVIPWNFPLLMLAWKIAPALATGNTVVLKPAETTPLAALLFAEICQQADLPPGVVNIVTGMGDTGAAIVNHPGIDKIAFTGSTEVGKIIRKATAGTGRKLSLELGGDLFQGSNDGLTHGDFNSLFEAVVPNRHGSLVQARFRVLGDMNPNPIPLALILWRGVNADALQEFGRAPVRGPGGIARIADVPVGDQAHRDCGHGNRAGLAGQ